MITDMWDADMFQFASLWCDLVKVLSSRDVAIETQLVAARCLEALATSSMDKELGSNRSDVC